MNRVRLNDEVQGRRGIAIPYGNNFTYKVNWKVMLRFIAVFIYLSAYCYIFIVVYCFDGFRSKNLLRKILIKSKIVDGRNNILIEFMDSYRLINFIIE